MAEHARNFKEWELHCTFHSKGIGDQCDKISKHVLNGLLQDMI